MSKKRKRRRPSPPPPLSIPPSPSPSSPAPPPALPPRLISSLQHSLHSPFPLPDPCPLQPPDAHRLAVSAGGHRGNHPAARDGAESTGAAERYFRDRRSPNRPTHVEVDESAWRVVKAEAARQRLLVGDVVGLLVKTAVDKGLPPQREPQRDPQRPRSQGRRAGRFARLLGVDDKTWLEFRALAIDAHVSTARAVGLVVEADARELGWGPERDR